MTTQLPMTATISEPNTSHNTKNNSDATNIRLSHHENGVEKSAQIAHCAIHHVGNAQRDEELLLSAAPLALSDDIKNVLAQYFLDAHFNKQLQSHYRPAQYLRFIHETDLALNEVYNYVSAVFADASQLHAQSVNLAKHLYQQSTHPNIKSGEFCVVYFTGIIADKPNRLNNSKHISDTVPDAATDTMPDAETDKTQTASRSTRVKEEITAVGLFKSENKNTFIKVSQDGSDSTDVMFDVRTEQGISVDQLDKGCIIFNCEAQSGYMALVVDNTNKGNEAQYWTRDFLQLAPRKDEFSSTTETLSVYKQFITEALPAKQTLSKTDQAEYLTRSIDFFEQNERFDADAFEAEVIQQPEVIDYFEEYKKGLAQNNDVQLEDNFAISDKALKKQARYFRSVIKLDKNFHIYVHGERQKIEQGTDNKGKFYKLYYDEES